jgi:hypothetical protein
MEQRKLPSESQGNWTQFYYDIKIISPVKQGVAFAADPVSLI